MRAKQLLTEEFETLTTGETVQGKCPNVYSKTSRTYMAQLSRGVGYHKTHLPERLTCARRYTIGIVGVHSLDVN